MAEWETVESESDSEWETVSTPQDSGSDWETVGAAEDSDWETVDTSAAETAEAVRKALPKTLEVGFGDYTFDTGIELSEDVSAFLVGQGHMMSDTFRGIKQIAGRDIEEEKENERHMNALYSDERFRTSALAGAVTGALAEPVGTAAAFIMPQMKAKSMWKIAQYSAIAGSSFGAAGYVDEESGQTRLQNAMLGGVVGGVLSTTLVGAFRGVDHMAAKRATKAADNTLGNLEATIADKRLRGGMKNKDAVASAYTDLGMTADDVTDLVIKSSRSAFNPDNVANTKVKAKMVVDAWSAKSTKHESKLGKKWETVKQKAEDLLVPMTRALENVSPHLAMEVRRSDAHQGINTGRWLTKTVKVRDAMSKLTDEQSVRLNKHLVNSEWSDAIKLGKSFGIDPEDMKAAKSVYKEAEKGLGAVGYDLKFMKNYWHRSVKDFDGVAKQESEVLKKIYSAAKKKAGGAEPTPEQINSELTNFMKRPSRKYMSTGGGIQKRKLKDLDDELMPFYHRPEHALELYIHQTSEDIARGQVFRAMGHKGSVSSKGDDFDKITDKVLKNTFLNSPEDFGKVKSLLRARYVEGVQSPGKAISAGKNILYASLLGNPLSAMTQFGDLIFPMYKYGILDTALTWTRAARSAVKGSDRMIKKERLGMYDAVVELADSASMSKKVLDWSLKLGGFTAVDRLGKETLINTAHRYYTRMATKNPAKFKAKWGKFFEGETDQLMKDLGDKKLSDNVLTMLYSELADVQPVALSEMPKLYLNHPKGRTLYMLRSYTIKQLNFMRDIVRNEPNAYKAGAKSAYFMSLFMAANVSIDIAKDFLNGKDFQPEHQALDNFLQMFGFSAYSAKEVREQGLATAVLNYVAPPITVVDNLTTADTPEDVLKESVFLTPVVGRVAKAIDGWQ